MTDRVKGFIVTLKPNIRDDDAEPIAAAIRLLAGVVSVRPHVADFHHAMAVEQARTELRSRLWEALNRELQP